MSDDGRAAEATELVFLPERSLAPLAVACGLMLIFAGAFTGWFFAALGGVLALGGLRRWLAGNRASIARMPRSR